ncbi:MAG: NAD+ synthase [Gammaproteobacteria bacterium]
MNSSDLRIVVAQLNLLVGDIEGNVDRILDAVNESRDKYQADMVVFPELAVTGYPPEDLLLRPGMYERIDKAMEQLVHGVSGITAVVGFPHHSHHGVYNAAAVISDQKIQTIEHKQILPNYSVFDEKRYFVSDETPCVFEINNTKIGILICEDIWHPEPFQRISSVGADLVVNLNASPYHVHKGEEREAIVQARISENNIPVVYINLVGGQDELVFDGDSFVMNAKGQVTQRMPLFEEGLFAVDFIHEGNKWSPQQQLDLVQRPSLEACVYQALVIGVRDFVHKNGFKGAVIGLSGGIDSALTLAVAVDALGAEEVEGVLMPSRYTSGMSIEDAELEAKKLGVEYSILPIENPFTSFLELLAEEFKGYEVDTTEENIQARCRGLILMAISNKKRKMVLTTGNKSEMAVGYATLYGDMAGGYDVLKDVPKTLVYRLAEYRNSLGEEVIPQRVIDRPPSAELAPDQKDTDSLPDYPVLDAILERYVEQDQGLDDIVAAGFERNTVSRVIKMVDRNEYKRRQAPPGIRITARAFGRDRRYPITSGYGKDR